MTQRRKFLINAPLGLLAVAGAVSNADAGTEALPQDSAPPGAPPTFGATPAVGPEVSPATFAEAEKLMQVTLTPAQRRMAAENWRISLASTMERRTGPRKVALAPELAPATVWDPASVTPETDGPARERFVRTHAGAGASSALPAKEEDIAYAPVTQLSRW